ncbi:hypothetical protein [Oxalobacter paraformigenes]|uniref:Uncharacterized protein n=1 Tax=Oxalobacter paraformigenes TaxID=556268 RepID=T5LSR3_9BURK|nr:hypothetical protein [Oxalobacter paraformigenes]EQM95094.1 hypothetical protein OFAG_02318 [Oxalobacter paraformigenes]
MTLKDLPHEPEAAHALLKQKLNEHTAAINSLIAGNRKQDERLERIEKNTATLVEIFRAGDGTLKTIKWFGKLLIWVGSLSSALYALWYAIINWPHRGG